MGDISLTKIMFAILISLFTLVTLFGSYSQFAILNNSTIQQPYKGFFDNLSVQYNQTTALSSTVGSSSTAQNILNLGKQTITGTVNVFITGLESLGSFFSLVPIIGNLFSQFNLVVPWLSGLMGLLLILVTIYFAMRYIQSASNKFYIP